MPIPTNEDVRDAVIKKITDRYSLIHAGSGKDIPEKIAQASAICKDTASTVIASKIPEILGHYYSYLTSDESPFSTEDRQDNEFQKVVDAIKPNGLLHQDLKSDKFKATTNMLSDFMKNMAIYMESVSMADPVKAKTAITMFPQQKKEDYACVAGTKSRMQLASLALCDKNEAMITASYDHEKQKIMTSLIGKLDEGNEIHLPPAIDYMMGVPAEVTEKSDAFYRLPLPQIPAEMMWDMYRNTHNTMEVLREDILHIASDTVNPDTGIITMGAQETHLKPLGIDFDDVYNNEELYDCQLPREGISNFAEKAAAAVSDLIWEKMGQNLFSDNISLDDLKKIKPIADIPSSEDICNDTAASAKILSGLADTRRLQHAAKHISNILQNTANAAGESLPPIEDLWGIEFSATKLKNITNDVIGQLQDTDKVTLLENAVKAVAEPLVSISDGLAYEPSQDKIDKAKRSLRDAAAAAAEPLQDAVNTTVAPLQDKSVINQAKHIVNAMAIFGENLQNNKLAEILEINHELGYATLYGKKERDKDNIIYRLDCVLEIDNTLKEKVENIKNRYDIYTEKSINSSGIKEYYNLLNNIEAHGESPSANELLNNQMHELILHNVDTKKFRSIIKDKYSLQPDRDLFKNLVKNDTSLDMLEILNKKGMDLTDNMYVISKAASTENFPLLEFIKENKISFNVVNEGGQTPMHYAATNGHHKVIEFLAGQGLDLSCKDTFGYTPAYYAGINEKIDALKEIKKGGGDITTHDEVIFKAAKTGNFQLLEFMKENNVIFNIVDKNGQTPAHYAAKNGNHKVIEFLAGQGLDLSCKDTFGYTPAHYAAINGNVDVLKEIHKNKGNLHVAGSKGDTKIGSAFLKLGKMRLLKGEVPIDSKIHQIGVRGYTPIQLAARYGNAGALAFLADNGGDIHKAGPFGYTPIYEAAYRGYPKTLKAIIDRGGKINKKNGIGGLTPLEAATMQGHYHAVKVLVSHGADVNKRNFLDDKSAAFALKRENTNIFKLLFAKETNPNAKDVVGDTYAYIAAKKNNPEALGVILKANADKDKGNWLNGRTPVYIAVTNRAKESLNVLIQHGADLNKANKKGKTPLLKAVKAHNIDITRMLINGGADLNKANKKDKTPLLQAIENNNIELLKILIEAGADINQANKDGETPLFVAAKMGCSDIVEILLGKGADKSIANNKGNTPENIAHKQKNFMIENIIKDYTYNPPVPTPDVTPQADGSELSGTNSFFRDRLVREREEIGIQR